MTFKASAKKSAPTVEILEAIERRHSHKHLYKKEPLKSAHRKALQIDHVPNTEIAYIDDVATIGAIAALHQNSINKLGRDARFGAELSRWLRDNSGRHHDGMPGMVTGVKGPTLYIIRALIRRVPKMITILGKKDYAVLSASPLVGVVATQGNAITDWVNAGRAYEAAAIAATAHGVVSAPLTAMMEDAEAVTELQKIFKLRGKTLQVFLRFGYSDNPAIYTPRRPMAEVLR